MRRKRGVAKARICALARISQDKLLQKSLLSFHVLRRLWHAEYLQNTVETFWLQHGIIQKNESAISYHIFNEVINFSFFRFSYPLLPIFPSRNNNRHRTKSCRTIHRLDLETTCSYLIECGITLRPTTDNGDGYYVQCLSSLT